MVQRMVSFGGALLLLLAGCGGAESTAPDDGSSPDVASETAMESSEMAQESSEMAHDEDAEADEHAGSFAFGEPADPADADRTVDVEAQEEGGFSFEPDTIEVAEGETVTFNVTNVGEAVHEFVIGDEHTQEEHEAEMEAMRSEGEMVMHDEPNAFALQPGETKTLTWTFSSAGELIYGCHQPGHYDAGMRGTLVVTD
ncbi:MAG TPA: plastocyanin/azurin family copper-binding protein [Euzebyales bacterium]